MMTKREAARHVNSDWEYKADGLIDRWSFKSPGDCENYSLLILKALFGSEQAAIKALMHREAFIWYVKTDNGVGHAILEYEDQFICNRTRSWMDDMDDMRIDRAYFRYPRAMMAVKLLVG